MTLVQNETLDMVDLATVEELTPLRIPYVFNSESLPLDDKRRTPEMMRYSDYALKVIPEATDIGSRLYLLFFFKFMPSVA